MAFNPFPSPPDSGDDRQKRARLRRSEATSSDSSDAGEFAIFSVRLRVAAPPPPPLPMTGEWDAQCSAIHQALGKDALANGAKEILAKENVEVLDVELVSRIPYGGGTVTVPKGQPTILIVARWVNEGSSAVWERAVSRIKKFVDSKRLSNGLGHVDIAVEMLAEELTLDKFISPVTSQLVASGMGTDWSYIRDKVGRILESYPGTKGHTTAIDLFRLGFSPDHNKNPNTVYVSVDYECRESTWPPVVGEIQQYLRGFKYADLHVHIEHGNVEHCGFPLAPSRRPPAEATKIRRVYNLLPKTPYHVEVNLGDDIGAYNYIRADNGNEFSPLVGTLGCWLMLKTTNHPNGLRVALTNYHVVRPAYAGFRVRADTDGEVRVVAPDKGSKLLEVDENGATPGAAIAKLEHPTRLKHNHGVPRQKEIVNISTGQGKAEAQHKLDEMVAFFDQDKHSFGTVYCASGFNRRTPNNGRLDWALIQPHDKARIGENSLPTLETWLAKYDEVSDLPAAALGARLKEPTARGLRGLSQGEFVYKVGATTEASIGIFNEMKSEVDLTDDRHVKKHGRSEEFSYIQGGTLLYGITNGAFGSKGDSGSVVWDKDGRVVGLLSTGKPVQQTEKAVVYVTPIHDVFEDIKKFSSGHIKEIRIC